ncbi:MULTISPECIES: ribosome-inactivating family protein [Streptomyces]|uniref:ribosome-inactivating family protein n=1 Tax=Streptomyces TaxID=1883 RepID=UPI0016774F64|nr:MULTISPECIES: ribosome-inactivating family protein [Streptomyces]MBD3575211.1 hypothetical protein [Streptomyces sp. KD18]GGS91415.1 hypothetical protein GCM10010286_15130 [Streptomyces toxytricini]
MRDATPRFIEMRVINNNNNAVPHQLSLYFRVENLYLEGFTTNGRNYRFTDPNQDLVTEFQNYYGAPGGYLWQTLPYNGGYVDLGATAAVRGAAEWHSYNVTSYIDSMIATRDGNVWDATRRRAMANIIAATSEAARIDWIRLRITMVIRHGAHDDGQGRQTTLGGFGVALENNWGRLSHLAARELNGTLRPQDAVNIGGTWYENLHHFRNADHNRQQLAPFMILYGAVG